MQQLNGSAEAYAQRNAIERRLDYERYAPQFDRMCEITPVYQDNIDLFLEFLDKFDLPENPRVCDLGAGTGNFVLAMAEQYPNADYTHLDFDGVMNSHASAKYQNKGLKKFTIVEEHMQRADFAANSFELIICVNALNTAAPQLPMLKMIHSWLKPGGHFFLIDFGREQKVVDWTWYIVKHLYKTHGVLQVFRSFWENREAIRQNRRARLDQKAGLMWTHTTDELRQAVLKAGFDVEHVQTCYREYSDLVVALKR